MLGVSNRLYGMNRLALGGFLLLLVIYLFSCKSKVPSQSVEKIQYEFSLDSYQGKSIQLKLLESGDYQISCLDLHNQRKDEYAGHYTVTSDSLVFWGVEESSSCFPQFAIRNGELLLIEIVESTENPTEITSPLDHRIVNYKAFGNEPFWSFTINDQELLHLKTLDNALLDQKIDLVNAKLTILPKKKIIKFISEETELTLVIYKESCSETMNGESFNNKVELNIRPTEKAEIIQYHGCGQGNDTSIHKK